MFFFNKNKKEKAAPKEVQKADKDELLKAAAEKKEDLKSAEDAARVKLLNELGSLYFQAEETDQAIFYYESSLNESKELGKAYTDLMKLYNKKRQEAQEAKDEEQVKLYMDKISELMTLSKDVIRGKA
ncbi:tetratricopeptide repeat protein [Anaerostipes sp.]|uniref:tetratricopeptide repeat protein n=1 Tax=Anaerostipes sp. TaxID=1872530 RepID=UPI0025B9DD2B|nr:tetratricopeptide repeat protein [Anaerostipes sp.]MBS7006932.1 tetratricopeptide repeat protein [Anaerostipes sp.]